MSFRDYTDIDNLRFSVIRDEGEYIPLMNKEDEESLKNEELPEELPILPLRNTVLFPGVVIPITAGRDKSISLLNKVNKDKGLLGVVSQIDGNLEEPGADDIYRVGTVARVVRLFKLPNGHTAVIIQGLRRFVINEIVQEEPHIVAKVSKFDEEKPATKDKQFKALMDSVKDIALEVIEKSPEIPNEASLTIKNIDSDTFLLNFVSNNMNADVEKKQNLLEQDKLQNRADEVFKLLNMESQMLEMKNEIQDKVRLDFDKQQRDYFLQQQLRQIQEELGGSSTETEIEEMRTKGKSKKWSDKVKVLFEKELAKMQRINPQVPEFSIQRNYLEFMLDLPWDDYTKDNFNLKRAERILNRDHYGLDKVKERLLEHLAVLKLKGDMKAPILCLYGPPGVGKTSLGRSVAEALGRPYVRMSLGGLGDEAEIRGHRKTYIGAMPGRILQSIKKAGASNPVFVLDEIDKLATGRGHGDPASAMLEVLDPEQNSTFYDNFLEEGYDLSKVIFIATANNINAIHPALRDRMEVIEINGYTVEEKVEIAAKHLLPKQIKDHGLTKDNFKLSKKAIEFMVEHHTRESGVRGLDKVLAKSVRYAAKSIAMEQEYVIAPKLSDMQEILGAERFNKDRYQDQEIAGLVTGLAWTPVGGDILYIESSLSRGRGRLSITGNLGDVMRESATIAMAYLKANAEDFDVDYRLFEQYDVHIHFPEGAIPKDGPSAGISILTSLTSLFTQRKVKGNLAMTGEITLRGQVLPVGGIKEKILAAKRANIKHIVISRKNEKDILEIRADYLKGLTFHYVDKMLEVIEVALSKDLVKDPKMLKVESKSIGFGSK
jgi:ATP-dependent Lon protease